MKILAIGSKQRHAKLPDVPTFAEAGVRDAEFTETWFGLFASKGTPPSAIRAWSSAVSELKSNSEVAAAFDTAGAYGTFLTPSAFSQQLAADESAMAILVKRFPPTNK